MQTLDVISINVWQIVISLVNLLILFFILKRFLYKPVRKTVEQREEAVREVYRQADEARSLAESERMEYEQKLAGADAECEELIALAKENARQRSGSIISEAEERASGMLARAESEIALEKSGAQAQMKREIAELSVQLAEKLLERELNAEDHRGLIDGFIAGIGSVENGSEGNGSEGNGVGDVGDR